MAERCPLSSEASPGFYFAEQIPEFCENNCEALWNNSVIAGESDHEEYPVRILSDSSCAHLVTEYGNSSLQSVDTGSSERLYSITERCTSCDDEIAEDTYKFICRKP